MNTNFTEDLLIKYLYGEVSIAEKHLVEESLENNWELQELYESMQKSHRELPKVQFSPEKNVIQNILKYSKEQTALEPHF
ncbi:MAG: anti-sigma factor RsiW [Saprospiraceae bacterium]|jgi:anti-sigma factor RsiW